MKITRRFGTGSQEGRLLTELERLGIAVFSFRKHRTLLRDFGDEQLGDLVYRLTAKGWLLSIERGKYLVVPRAARRGWYEHPFVIASGIASDHHYVSYWSALSFHHLTEQIPRVVYVAVTGQRKPCVSYQGFDYQFIHLARGKFFGFHEEEFTALNGAAMVQVPVSEPEKAILDSLDNELLAGGIPEIAKAVYRGLEENIISVDRMLEYGKRYPNAAVVARLGYLLQQLGITSSGELLPYVRRGGPLAYLSPQAPRDRSIANKPWHLWVNGPVA